MLGRLRQRIESPRQQPARDKEIACAFRGAFAQDRRFDLEEPLRIEILARRLGDAMAGPQVARQPRPAQVVIAISQLEIFVAEFGVELERKILGPVQDRERVWDNLDVAGCQLGIFRAR